jgi:signal transduction histidine kinase
MPGQSPASRALPRPGWLAASAIYLLYVAVLLRTLALQPIRERLLLYLALEFLYLLVLSLMLWRPAWQPNLRLGYFILQALIVFGLQAMRLRFDFLILLYIPLCYQAALLLRGPIRWIWVGIYLLLSCIPLMVALGALQGLAVALLPMTGGLIFPGYVVVNQELETSIRASQGMLAELQETNRQLQSYAAHVEQLSALQERSRLARELHDSVSQTIFSITLNTRAAQLLLEQAPERLRPQLEQLQSLTRAALEEMRGLITAMRLRESQADQQPTP